ESSAQIRLHVYPWQHSYPPGIPFLPCAKSEQTERPTAKATRGARHSAQSLQSMQDRNTLRRILRVAGYVSNDLKDTFLSPQISPCGCQTGSVSLSSRQTE